MENVEKGAEKYPPWLPCFIHLFQALVIGIPVEIRGYQTLESIVIRPPIAINFTIRKLTGYGTKAGYRIPAIPLCAVRIFYPLYARALDNTPPCFVLCIIYPSPHLGAKALAGDTALSYYFGCSRNALLTAR